MLVENERCTCAVASINLPEIAACMCRVKLVAVVDDPIVKDDEMRAVRAEPAAPCSALHQAAAYPHPAAAQLILMYATTITLSATLKSRSSGACTRHLLTRRPIHSTSKARRLPRRALTPAYAPSPPHWGLAERFAHTAFHCQSMPFLNTATLLLPSFPHHHACRSLFLAHSTTKSLYPPAYIAVPVAAEQDSCK